MSYCRSLLPLSLCLALAAGPARATENTSPDQKPEAPAASQALQAAPDAQPAIVGLAPEFGIALAAGQGKLSSAERADRAALAKFYEARQFEPVWITTTGVSPAGQAVMAEIAMADDWGLEASAFALPKVPSGSELSRADRAKFDTALSLAVLEYARYARGGRMDPTALSKFIDRKPPLREPGQVIEAAAASSTPDSYLRGLHPQHPQFERLRQKYLALKRGGPADAPEAAANARPGARKAAASDGPSARRLLVNMEQWRWMPDELGQYHVWINVPEYLVRVFRNGSAIHTERVIVGKTDTQTPIFSDEMEQVIFHPFWGVPDSIKRNEILPGLAKGSTRVLDRHNLRIQSGGRDINPETIDWSTTDIRKFHVYQPPGGSNVLGVVKFRFPNKHDVYLHDTPTKNLFNTNVRTYSHGCVRVRDPLKLAELLLTEDLGWPANRVASVVDSGPQNNHVNLKSHIPVHMTYFTAWVGDDGKLTMFPDIYDHESKIALGIEGKIHLIPRWKEDKAPVVADAVGSLAETKANRSSVGGKEDWMRRAFQN